MGKIATPASKCLTVNTQAKEKHIQDYQIGWQSFISYRAIYQKKWIWRNCTQGQATYQFSETDTWTPQRQSQQHAANNAFVRCITLHHHSSPPEEILIRELHHLEWIRAPLSPVWVCHLKTKLCIWGCEEVWVCCLKTRLRLWGCEELGFGDSTFLALNSFILLSQRGPSHLGPNKIVLTWLTCWIWDTLLRNSTAMMAEWQLA